MKQEIQQAIRNSKIMYATWMLTSAVQVLVEMTDDKSRIKTKEKVMEHIEEAIKTIEKL